MLASSEVCMVWNPAAVVLATLASLVLPSLAGTADADQAATQCERQQDQLETAAALLQHQHRVTKEQAAAKPARAKRKLPGFPTLAPPDERVKGPQDGVWDVPLDSMQDNLLEADAVQHPAKSRRRNNHDVRYRSLLKKSRPEPFEDDLDEEEDDAPNTSGHAAPLDSRGYRAVAGSRSRKEMKAFVQRVINKLGYQVESAGDLDGFVQYYSGEKGVQSIENMQKEIHTIAHKRGRGQWIVQKGGASFKEVSRWGASDDVDLSMALSGLVA